MVGHTGDIVVVITFRNTVQAQRKLRHVMLKTKTWLDSHGPCIKRNHWITLQVDMSNENEVIMIKSSVRYLGIRLSLRLTFLIQIQYSANKAQIQRLLMEVSNSIMLYGREIWVKS